MFKKLLSVLLAIVMMMGVFTAFPFTSNAQDIDLVEDGVNDDLAETGFTSSKTQAEAVDWLNNQNWAEYDFNGSYGTQCVEFVRAYVNYLVNGDPWSDAWGRATGNGDSIWANSLWNELGWTVYRNTPDFLPLPGDIFSSYYGDYGHTGAVISSDIYNATIADANARTSYWGNGDPVWVHDITWGRGVYAASYYIRPSFKSPVSYANMDVNFWVDGKEQYSIDGIGDIQVYVDGQFQGSGTDFYQDVVAGKYYEVKVNITNSDYHFGGVDTYESSYSGLTGTTRYGGTKVRIVICKDSGGIQNIPDGYYTIANVIDTSYGIDIAGDDIPATNGSNVLLYPIGTKPRPQDTFDIRYNGDGYYRITQKNTDMAIGVFGASCDRWGEVNVWNFNDSTNKNARLWKICYDSSIGGYTFQSKCSGMYLTLDGGTIENGSNIYQNIKSVIPKAQGWLLQPCDNTMDVSFYVDGKPKENIEGIGTIQVYIDGILQTVDNKTEYSEFCQFVKSGKPYEIKVNFTNNEYRLVGVDTFEEGYKGLSDTTGYYDTNVRLIICKDTGGTQNIPNGDYQIISIIDDTYGLDIDGNSIPASDGDNVNIYPLGNTPRMQDVFTLTKLDNGYYTITQKGTNMAIGVYGASCNRWGEVNMWNYNTSLDTNARQWKICYDNTIGGYTLQAKCSGMYMTIDGGTMRENTNVYQNIKSVIPKAQGWKFRRLINEDMVNISDVVIHSNTDEINPEITVIADNKPLVKDVDYQTNVTINIEAGKGKVVVSGINNYCNSITKEFAINIVPIILGDADGNGDVDIVDATIIQRHECNMTVPYSIEVLMNGDVDGDGELTVLDATFIQRFCSSMKTPYKIGEPIT